MTGFWAVVAPIDYAGVPPPRGPWRTEVDAERALALWVEKRPGARLGHDFRVLGPFSTRDDARAARRTAHRAVVARSVVAKSREVEGEDAVLRALRAAFWRGHGVSINTGPAGPWLVGRPGTRPIPYTSRVGALRAAWDLAGELSSTADHDIVAAVLGTAEEIPGFPGLKRLRRPEKDRDCVPAAPDPPRPSGQT